MDEACKLELRKLFSTDDLSDRDMDQYIKEVRAMKTVDPVNFDKTLSEYVSQKVLAAKEEAANSLVSSKFFTNLTAAVDSMSDENFNIIQKKLSLNNQRIHKIEALLSGRALGGKGSNFSIDRVQATLRAQLANPIEDVVVKHALTPDTVTSKAFGLDTLREIYHLNAKKAGFATENKAAREMAKVRVEQTYKDMRTMFLLAGKNIAYQDNYAGWRRYDRLKVASNRELFVKLVTGEGVDLEKTYSKEFTPDAKIARAGQMYDHIVNGNQADFSAHRSIFFSTAEAEHNFLGNFGYFDNDFQSTQAQIQTASKIAGLMRVLGPEYKENFSRLLKWADPGETNSAVARNMFRDLSGELSNPIETSVSQLTSAARQFTSLRMLWNAVMTAFLPDHVAAGALAGSVDGRGLWVAMHNTISDYMERTGPKERRRIAEMMMLNSYDLLATYSDNAQIGVNGKLTKAVASMMKYTGLQGHSEKIRSSVALTVGKILHEHVGEEFSTLPPKLLETFDRYNIGKSEWDVLRKAEADIEGIKILSPRAVLDIEGVDKKAANQAFIKVGAMVNDYAKMSTLEGDAYSRQILYWGTQEGTFPGELLRCMGQFKQAGANMVRLQGRLYHSYELPAYSAALGMFSLAGYLGYQGREILVKGHTPEKFNMNTEDGRVRALILAAESMNRGAGGILGDTLTAEYNKSYRSLTGDIMGPVFSDAGKMAKYVSAAFRGEAKQNETEMINFAKTLIPGTQAAGISPVLEGLVMDNLHNMLNSSYEANVKRKLRERGQKRLKDLRF